MLNLSWFCNWFNKLCSDPMMKKAALQPPFSFILLLLKNPLNFFKFNSTSDRPFIAYTRIPGFMIRDLSAPFPNWLREQKDIWAFFLLLARQYPLLAYMASTKRIAYTCQSSASRVKKLFDEGKVFCFSLTNYQPEHFRMKSFLMTTNKSSSQKETSINNRY